MCPAQVNYADINPGDVPTVKTSFDSFTYKDAQDNDVTATLTAEQLAAIAAVEVPLGVVQDPNGDKHWLGDLDLQRRRTAPSTSWPPAKC